MSKITISAIVASAKNRVIGDGEQLFWKIPEDFRRLKEITMGCPLIMGRKTWNSIGRPLPGRASIVLTKSLSWKAEGAIVANSFENAITEANIWIEANKKMGNKAIQNKIFLFENNVRWNIFHNSFSSRDNNSFTNSYSFFYNEEYKYYFLIFLKLF